MKYLQTPYLFVGIGLLLLIPLLAMQFTTAVNWSASDFVIMGALLLATGLLLRVANGLQSSKTFKTAIMAAVILLFLLIWGELAVGLFGSPWAGN
ncbi:MAG: hypothetical protein Q8J69_09835 [Sphingobacteriaceae bacterium]|nr:hypothetical protein [Sphingobacteriaceae bacterium]